MENNQALLEALSDCANACQHCAGACLKEEHVQMMAECIRTDLDCADICTLVAKYVARGSAHAKHLLQECIEICELCAAECEKHDMAHCQACAKACRACAEACKAAA